MSEAPALLETKGASEPTRIAVAEAASARRGAHRLVYLAMLFSIALGLLFASDTLVSSSYDLPDNALTESIVLAAEKWDRGMQTIGLAKLASRIRDALAAARGE